MSDRKTILVVDSEAAPREMIVEYLSGLGHVVSGTDDAEGMRRHLATGPVDVVLLDCTAANGGAFDLVPDLAQRPGLGLIVITAADQEEERVRSLELGADDFVSKPIVWRELAARVQAVLRRLSVAPPPPEPDSDSARMRLLTLSRSLRRDATILFADVEGYTRMVRADEAGTLRLLGRYLKDVIAPTLAGHGGRLVKTIGDGLFADMPGADAAITAALAIQRELDLRNRALPPEARMRFRIAIHHAPVIAVDGGDLFGDGVNVAARLQALAPAGGVLISEAVRAIAGVASASWRLVDLGPQRLKNVGDPVRAFRVDPPLPTPVRPIRVR
jgi:Adenylate cyclase, family 3 (some proteins contain HAMP domain)